MRKIHAKMNEICKWLDGNSFYKESEEIESIMLRLSQQNPDYLKNQQTPLNELPPVKPTVVFDPIKKSTEEQKNLMNVSNPNWEKEQHNPKSIPQSAQQYTNHYIDASRQTGLSVPLRKVSGKAHEL